MYKRAGCLIWLSILIKDLPDAMAVVGWESLSIVEVWLRAFVLSAKGSVMKSISVSIPWGLMIVLSI
jgi:hypothetical protein